MTVNRSFSADQLKCFLKLLGALMPEVIYSQHPATSVRYELEDVTDVENFSVLELIVKVEQGGK